MTQATLGQARMGCKMAWLFDWWADLLCFYVPLVFAIAMLSLSVTGSLAAIIALFVLFNLFPLVGSMHGAATWFHYTDKKNQEYYFGNGKRIFIFGVAPWLITIICAIAYACHLHDYVFSIYMVWTIQHLTQQNVGILLLYHNRGEATVERGIEARSQQIPAAIFGGLFLIHLYYIGPIVNLSMLAGVCACILLALHYMWCLFKKAKEGAPVNLPALCFWFLSVWFFLPMLFVDTYYKGMMLPLFVHWCQYVGLNCVLVARRHEATKTMTTRKKKPVAAFLLFCAALTFMFTITIYFSNMAPDESLRNILAGLVMAGSLVHYFQDAFIWRFREQFQRETILPYIKLKKEPAGIRTT